MLLLQTLCSHYFQIVLGLTFRSLTEDSKKMTGSQQSLSNAQGTYLSSVRLGVVILSLCLGILLFGLDVNIIGTAIPQITTDFHSLPDVSWYGSAYLLTVTAFQPLFGNMYKFFTAKLVYLGSLLVFEGEQYPQLKISRLVSLN